MNLYENLREQHPYMSDIGLVRMIGRIDTYQEMEVLKGVDMYIRFTPDEQYEEAFNRISCQSADVLYGLIWDKMKRAPWKNNTKTF